MFRFLLCLAAALSALPLVTLADEPAVQEVAGGLEFPWSIAELPDGRLLVTERAGRLRVIEEGRVLPEPVSGLPPVYVRGQGGLFEVLLSPDFAASGWLYLSFAHGDDNASTTRVIRARLVANALVGISEIFGATPMRDTPVHYGGRMAWHPDGSLLLGLGDGFDYREAAQDATSHLGKIVRLDAAGGPARLNPPITNLALPEIYSLGHRNVQGLAVDSETGRIWSHEHGPRGGDELNLIRPAGNYGWPLASHGVDYSGARISPFTEYPDTVAPILHWTPSIAPAGLAIYRGAMFPEWDGDLLVAALAERSLRRIELDQQGQVTGQHTLLEDLDERLRDVRVVSDGSILLLTDAADGRVLRLLRP